MHSPRGLATEDQLSRCGDTWRCAPQPRTAARPPRIHTPARPRTRYQLSCRAPFPGVQRKNRNIAANAHADQTQRARKKIRRSREKNINTTNAWDTIDIAPAVFLFFLGGGYLEHETTAVSSTNASQISSSFDRLGHEIMFDKQQSNQRQSIRRTVMLSRFAGIQHKMTTYDMRVNGRQHVESDDSWRNTGS